MPQKRSIKESMDRFLSQYLPMLFQQQQREGYVDYSQAAYLKRRLEEMAKMDEYAVSASDRAKLNNMLQNFFSVLGTETEALPYGSSQFAERSAPAAAAYGLKPIPRDPKLAGKTQRYSQVAQQLMMSKISGDEPPPEIVEEAVSLFGLDAVVNEVAKFNEAAAKKIDQEHREQEIGIKRITAKAGKTTSETAALELADTERKEWLTFVTDVEDHLRQEGVTGGKLSDRLEGLFSTGRILDPLSSENRGAAYTYLGKIRAKLIQRQKLTSGEIRFLTTVRSTYQIEGVPGVEGATGVEGAGLTDPAVTDVELETRESMIQAHMDVIREMTGETDEATLRKLAEEFLRTIK